MNDIFYQTLLRVIGVLMAFFLVALIGTWCAPRSRGKIKADERGAGD